MDHTVVLIVAHMRMAQCITKDLDTLLIKSQDRGVAQAVTQMRVRHQKDMEDMVVEDMLVEVTANQCGG